MMTNQELDVVVNSPALSPSEAAEWFRQKNIPLGLQMIYNLMTTNQLWSFELPKGLNTRKNARRRTTIAACELYLRKSLRENEAQGKAKLLAQKAQKQVELAQELEILEKETENFINRVITNTPIVRFDDVVVERKADELLRQIREREEQKAKNKGKKQ